MAPKSLVQDVHNELTRMRDEAVRFRESPRLISFMDQVLRLTNIDGDSQKPESEAAPTVADETAPEQTDPETCPHKVTTLYGVCAACGTCTHTNAREGVCITCGESV